MSYVLGVILTVVLCFYVYTKRMKLLSLEILILLKLDVVMAQYKNKDIGIFNYDDSHFNNLLFYWNIFKPIDNLLKESYDCEALYNFVEEYNINLTELLECKDVRFFQVDKFKRS